MENTTIPNVPQQPLSKKQQRRLEKQQLRQSDQHFGSKKSNGRLVFWLLIVAVIGFFVYVIGKLASSTPDIAAVPTDIAITESDHTLGTQGAPVELIEYADFQCPGCAAFHPIIEEIMDEYGDRVAYAYRHYPLPQHRHAKIMGRATEAAGAQGKFFEMADLIFTNQRAWTALPNVMNTIEGYATQLGLDMETFKQDLEGSQYRDRVDSDLVSGAAYGVNSTPTFFLNGAQIPLPRNIGEFKAVLDNAITNATAIGA